MTQSFRIPREQVPSNTANEPERNGPDETITWIRISEVEVADSPRLDGTDEEHIRLLAGVSSRLPPILVHRESMRVIDGMHRLTAARMNGAEEIEAKFFHGSDAEAFVLAVRTNTTHGLPLTATDRQAAATRIIASHPELSDRAVAGIVGLSARTVSNLRKRAGDTLPQRRLGRDGRLRPLSTVEGRRIAGQLFADQPQSSLREVAKQAGISVSTARDVRLKMSADRRDEHSAAEEGLPGKTDSGADLKSMIESLRRDPSIRYSERGQAVLRWLALRTITAHQYRQVIDDVPSHTTGLLTRIARECAAAWTEFADELDNKSVPQQ